VSAIHPSARLRRAARLCLAALLAAGLSPAGGCRPKPRAPALLDEPVYQNAREGFRFLVPEGWIIAARADVPPGPAETERMLVQYQHSAGEKPATFEVSLADLPEGTDLASHLAGPSFGAEHWDLSGPPEKVEVDGVAGTRYGFTARADRKALAREVTAFRRGGRVYFFTALASRDDTGAREQVRRAVGRIIWTK
jgi:hypothetical protein